MKEWGRVAILKQQFAFVLPNKWFHTKGFDNKDVLGVNCINELHNTNRIAPPLKFEWFPEEQKTMIKVSYVCEGKVGDYLFQLDNIW